jgi:hypothetical protein
MAVEADEAGGGIEGGSNYTKGGGGAKGSTEGGGGVGGVSDGGGRKILVA